MDIRLTWNPLSCWLVAAMLFSQTTLPVSAADCVNLQEYWVNAGVPAFIPCGLGEPGHFWWKGSDACDMEGFGRLGINTQSCKDGSSVCQIPENVINKEPNTIVCCTENGPVRFEEALHTECHQVAVCPSEAELTVPSIVETDRVETAYIKVITKPPPPLLPLLDIRIPGRESINYTEFLAPPLEAPEKAVEHVYTFRFQVPREMVVDSATTIQFEPHFNMLPRGDSCSTVSVETAMGIRVLASAVEEVTTMEPSTSPTPFTDGQSSEPCMAPAITIGASIAAFIIGLIAGLIPPLVWLAVRQRRGKQYSSSSQRDLPEPPVSLSFHQPVRAPPTSVQFLQSNGHNGTLQNTPTPTDQSRLLAGQTPNNCPPPDSHPFNPSSAEIPPYATTDQMRAMHLETRGHGYPPPMGSSGFSMALGGHKITDFPSSSQVPGGSPFRRSHSPVPDTKSPLYAREGEGMDNFISSPTPIAVV